MDRSFTYDNNGQLLKCKESKEVFDKTTYTYEHDAMYNILSGKDSFGNTLTYEYKCVNKGLNQKILNNIYFYTTLEYNSCMKVGENYELQKSA